MLAYSTSSNMPLLRRSEGVPGWCVVCGRACMAIQRPMQADIPLLAWWMDFCVKQTVERDVRVPASRLEGRSVLGSGGEKRRVGRSLVGSAAGALCLRDEPLCPNRPRQPRTTPAAQSGGGGHWCTLRYALA